MLKGHKAGGAANGHDAPTSPSPTLSEGETGGVFPPPPNRSAEENVPKMTPTILVLSGPMAAGKSTLAKLLQDENPETTVYVNTRDALNARPQPGQDLRTSLQEQGRNLEKKTRGRWVLHLLERKVRDNPHAHTFVIDCVRSPRQFGAIRQRFPDQTTLVHLTSPANTLQARYEQRGDKTAYAKAAKHPSERRIGDLKEMADLVIDSSTNNPDHISKIIAAHRLANLNAPT